MTQQRYNAVGSNADALPRGTARLHRVYAPKNHAPRRTHVTSNTTLLTLLVAVHYNRQIYSSNAIVSCPVEPKRERTRRRIMAPMVPQHMQRMGIP